MANSTVWGIVILILIVLGGLFYLGIFQISSPTGNVVKSFEENSNQLDTNTEIEFQEEKKVVYATANDLKIELFHTYFFSENDKRKTDLCSDEDAWEDLDIRILLTHQYDECRSRSVDCPNYVCTTELLQGENIDLYREHPGRWGLERSEGFSAFGKVAFSQSIHKPHQVQVCCETHDKKSSFCKTAYLGPYCN